MFKLNIERILIAIIALVALTVVWAKPALSQTSQPVVVVKWDFSLKSFVYKDSSLGEDVFCAVSPKANGQCWLVSDIAKVENGEQIEPTKPESGIGVQVTIIPPIDYLSYPSETRRSEHFCPIETTFLLSACWSTEDILKGSTPNGFRMINNLNPEIVFKALPKKGNDI